jgi:flagellar hook-basal body complex protein FliE
MMIELITSSAISPTGPLQEFSTKVQWNRPSNERNVVADFAKQFSDTIRAGESAAISGVLGEVPLQETIEKVLAAERSLSAAISIRDKIVSSLLELGRMQI